MTANEKELVQELIRTIPDFPEPGILFRDITTLLKDKKGLQLNVFEKSKNQRFCAIHFFV